MGTEIPKQYLPLRGAPVLAHTLERLASHPGVHGVVVALTPGDAYFAAMQLSFRERLLEAPGGRERSDSVLNALEQVAATVTIEPARDWALVHDAVRPCLHRADLDRLIDAALGSKHGALLATPTRDTMKRVRGGHVVETVAREELWHALTPQMFPLTALRSALEAARAEGVQVTDETQAMERTGWQPLAVHGRADNIKITRPEDLELAGHFLSHMEL